jgi:hypothetical protein
VLARAAAQTTDATSDTASARPLKLATENTRLALLVTLTSSANNTSFGLPICRAKIVTPALRSRAASINVALLRWLLLRLAKPPNRLIWMSTATFATPVGRIPLDTLKTVVRSTVRALSVAADSDVCD